MTICAAASVGGELKSQLPWIRMARTLCEQNIIMENYPEKVPFPGKEEKSKKSQKGIASLSLEMVQRLWYQIDHPKYPLSFRKVSASEGQGKSTSDFNTIYSNICILALAILKAPVIIGVPPPSTSEYNRGRQLFYRGNEDRRGPLQRTSQSPGPMGEDAPGADEDIGDASEEPEGSNADEADGSEEEDYESHTKSHRLAGEKGKLRAASSGADRRQTRARTQAEYAET